MTCPECGRDVADCTCSAPKWKETKGQPEVPEALRNYKLSSPYDHCYEGDIVCVAIGSNVGKATVRSALYEAYQAGAKEMTMELLTALKNLVVRAEREMVDPVDVGEIQWAKEVIAKVEATK
jgi:hypothetical protein